MVAGGCSASYCVERPIYLRQEGKDCDLNVVLAVSFDCCLFVSLCEVNHLQRPGYRSHSPPSRAACC